MPDVLISPTHISLLPKCSEGEMEIGETGVDEMGVGETGSNRKCKLVVFGQITIYYNSIRLLLF